MQTLIKICGVKTPETIDAAAKHGASHVGLVHFAKSPRHVTIDQAAALRTHMPRSMKAVLLLVNATADVTAHAIAAIRPDVVQFHGDETPAWLRAIRDAAGIEVWKALGVKTKEALEKSSQFMDSADRLLFDAPAQPLPSALPGGTGTRVDWSLFSGYRHAMPWGLAGGLDSANVAEAMRITRPPLVDVSSGVETAPGVKDVDKIAAFCKAVRCNTP